MRRMAGVPLLLAVAASFALAGTAGAAERGPAPDYGARLLGTDDEVRLADLRGEVLLLNTWATWCKPCQEEMPDFEALHRRYQPEGLRVVGVNTDEGRGDTKVVHFVEQVGVTYEIWRDPGNRFADDFRVLGPPETFLVDRDGRIVRHWRGQMDPNRPANLSSIQAALAGDAKSAGATGTVATAGLLIAFGAGLISVLSPCVLPLVPSYASVVAGVSLGRRSRRPATGAGAPGRTAMSRQAKSHEHSRARGAALRAGLAFVAGFTSVFMTLGILVNRAGAALADNREWLTRAGGVVLVILGLHLVGVLRIRAADKEVRLLEMGRGPGRPEDSAAGPATPVPTWWGWPSPPGGARVWGRCWPGS